LYFECWLADWGLGEGGQYEKKKMAKGGYLHEKKLRFTLVKILTTN